METLEESGTAELLLQNVRQSPGPGAAQPRREVRQPVSAFWRWHRPAGPDDVINDLEKSDSLYLFSLPQNPRTPSESGKQQFPRGEATSSCRRCLWVSQYLKTLQSQNLARQKQVLYVYTGNKITRVLSTAVSLAESLPGTLGGSHSPAQKPELSLKCNPWRCTFSCRIWPCSRHPGGEGIQHSEGCGDQHPTH